MTPALKIKTPVDEILAASTAADVETILASLPDPAWRALGDRKNNYAPVNVGAEPADGWAEKVINGIDGIVEDEVEIAGDADLADPRAAAAKYLGVPGGHVWSLDPDRRRALAERLIVTVRPGSAADPTIVVRDTGIGQHPKDFPTTLVSLNESNKRDKVYLMGAYGWGGASSYAFSRYTIYVSRRNPALLKPGEEDLVGWTIVRYNPLNEERFSKTGVYEYLVLPGDPGPVRGFDPADLPAELRDWHGTSVTMVDYRLGKYSAAPAFEPKESLYILGNGILFDPIMPFLLRDERPASVARNPSNALKGVLINGSATKLEDLKKRRRGGAAAEGEEAVDDKITYSNTYTGRLSTGGAVTIRYWVLGESGKYRRDWQPTRAYVMADQAVTITHNGQRHMAYPRALFERLGLMALSKALLVHVDTDGLDWQEKRELFSTTRDRLKESPITEDLRRQLDTTLRSDEALAAEDRRRKERALSRTSKEQAERIRAKLAKAIEALRKGVVQKFRTLMSTNTELPLFSDQLLVDPPVRDPNTTGEDGAEDAETVVYSGAPTFVKVLNAPIKVPAGSRAIVRLAIDAADDYFSANPGLFLPILSRGKDGFSVLGFSDVKGGRMRCTISAASASAGDRGRIVFTVVSLDGLPLVDEADLEATEPPAKRVKPAGKDDGKLKGGPDVIQIFRPQWSDLDFDEQTVAKLEGDASDPNLLRIYVNMDYPPVVAALMGKRKASPEELDNYGENYAALMAFVAWLQNQDEKTESINQAEMRRAAQAWVFTALTTD